MIKEPTKSISYSSDAVDYCENYNLTVHDNDGNKVTLKLNENQCMLIESRKTRSFYIRCRKEKILQEIDSAYNYTALEDIAKKYYLCDVCSFGGIKLNSVKQILKVVVETLYKYPKLRSKLCFIGTHHELEKMLIKMEQGDKEVLNAFSLQYICTGENEKQLGSFIHGILSRLMKNHEGYVATAMCAFGLLDAILLDKNDFEGYAYSEFIERLRENEKDGFHPKCCNTPESIVYHELGHLLDDLCGLNENAEFKTYYKSLMLSGIKNGLSKYACTSPKEFIAEAFAEYMCNPVPRPIAQKVGELLDMDYDICDKR